MVKHLFATAIRRLLGPCHLFDQACTVPGNMPGVIPDVITIYCYGMSHLPTDIMAWGLGLLARSKCYGNGVARMKFKLYLINGGHESIPSRLLPFLKLNINVAAKISLPHLQFRRKRVAPRVCLGRYNTMHTWDLRGSDLWNRGDKFNKCIVPAIDHYT